MGYPTPVFGDAGMASLDRGMWGAGPAGSQAEPMVPVPVSQPPGSGGARGPGDPALSHCRGWG